MSERATQANQRGHGYVLLILYRDKHGSDCGGVIRTPLPVVIELLTDLWQ